MSKGSNRRPTDQSQFRSNFDNIKWGSVSFTPKPVRERQKSHHIMPDIEPYMPVAGSGAFKQEITSRSKEREYLRRNGMVQVGNEKDYFFKHNGKSDDNPTREW